MYLAVVMDLCSRRIVGWHMDNRLTKNLAGKALMKAVNLCVNLNQVWFFIMPSLSDSSVA